LLGKRAEIALITILIIGIIGYAAAGIVIAGSHIASAEHTLNSVVSHQNTLNATFRDINSELSALGGSSTFDAEKALALVDASVANSELAAETVSADDAALGSAERRLQEHRWLTMVSDSGVDRTEERIGHARRALEVARGLAADEILDGRFWRALYTGLADLKKLEGQKDSFDSAGARGTLTQMKADIDLAAELSTSPGLPSELQSLTADLQQLVVDYGKQLDAEAAGDDVSAVRYGGAVSTDVSRIGKYDIDSIGAEIDAYFKPAIDRYNVEIAKATA
jgi:hypothetical protein